MTFIWIFNLSVQLFGMWVVFGDKSKDIKNYTCSDKIEGQDIILTDQCQRNQKIV